MMSIGWYSKKTFGSNDGWTLGKIDTSIMKVIGTTLTMNGKTGSRF